MSHMYYNPNSNIKYIGSTIKFIRFISIHYIINLDVVLSFKEFNDFDYVFISIYCWFESIKSFFSSKKDIYIVNNLFLYYVLNLFLF